MSIIFPQDRLDAVVDRHAVLTATLAAGPDAETFVSLSRELAELGPVVAAIHDYRAARAELEGVEALLSDPATDREMRDLAEEERGTALRASTRPRGICN